MPARTRFLSLVVSTAAILAFAQPASAQNNEKGGSGSGGGAGGGGAVGVGSTGAPGEGPTVNGQSLTMQTTNNSPVDQFGTKGTIAISSDAALSISNTSLSGVDGSSTQIMLAPAIDWFVIRNLSIGGSLLFNYRTDGTGNSTSFGIGPRVGYNIAFSDLLSIWPKLGFSIARSSVSTDGTPQNPATGTVSNTAVALNVFVPVMLHPAPHFFAGFGPFVDADLTGDNKATTFGAKLTLGGWL